MLSYQRYIVTNIIVIGCYILFWLISLLLVHFPVWANIGAALVTLAVMTVLYMMQQRRG